MGIRDLINARSEGSTPSPAPKKTTANSSGSVRSLIEARKNRPAPKPQAQPEKEKSYTDLVRGDSTYGKYQNRRDEQFTANVKYRADERNNRVTKAKEVLAKDHGNAWGEYSHSVNEGMGSAMRGVGDTVGMFGSALKFMGKANEDKGLWKYYSKLGETLQQAGTGTANQFKTQDSEAIDTLFNDDAVSALKYKEFWVTKVPQQIVPSLALMMPGAGLTGSLLYKTAPTLLKVAGASLAGSAISRPMESAAEAGGTYDEMIAKGRSEEEAIKAASQVYYDNLKLVGMDAGQLFLAMTPLKGLVGKNTGVMGKIIIGAAGMATAGITEGGEEVYQSYISARAQGEEFDIMGTESQQSFILGMIGGLAFQTAGMAMTPKEREDSEASYLNEVVSNLSPDLQSRFSDKMSTEDKAKTLEQLAKEDRGAVSKAVNAVDKNYLDNVKDGKKNYTKQETAEEVVDSLESGLSTEETALKVSQTTDLSIDEVLEVIETVSDKADINLPAEAQEDTFREVDKTIADKTASQLAKQAKQKEADDFATDTEIKKAIAQIQKEMQNEDTTSERKVELRTELESKRKDLSKAQTARENNTKNSASDLREIVSGLVKEAGVTTGADNMIDEAVALASSPKGSESVRDIVTRLAKDTKTTVSTPTEPKANQKKASKPSKEEAKESKKTETESQKKTAETKAKKTEPVKSKESQSQKKADKKTDKPSKESSETELEDDVKPSFSLEAIKSANPALFRKADKAKTVDEFIDAVVKADKTTRENVSIKNLTEFFERVKKITAEAEAETKAEETKESSDTSKDDVKVTERNEDGSVSDERVVAFETGKNGKTKVLVYNSDKSKVGDIMTLEEAETKYGTTDRTEIANFIVNGRFDSKTETWSLIEEKKTAPEGTTGLEPAVINTDRVLIADIGDYLVDTDGNLKEAATSNRKYFKNDGYIDSINIGTIRTKDALTDKADFLDYASQLRQATETELTDAGIDASLAKENEYVSLADNPKDSAFELFENEGKWKATTSDYKGRSPANFVNNFLEKKELKALNKIRDKEVGTTKAEAEAHLAELQAFEVEHADAFAKAKAAIDAIEDGSGGGKKSDPKPKKPTAPTQETKPSFETREDVESFIEEYRDATLAEKYTEILKRNNGNHDEALSQFVLLMKKEKEYFHEATDTSGLTQEGARAWREFQEERYGKEDARSLLIFTDGSIVGFLYKNGLLPEDIATKYKPEAVEAVKAEKEKESVKKTDPTDFDTAEEYVASKGTVIYHTTGAEFDKFDSEFLGSNTGDIADNVDRGFFFTETKKDILDFQATLSVGSENFRGNKLSKKDVADYRIIEKVADMSKFFQLNESKIMAGDIPVKDAEILSEIFGTEDNTILKGQDAIDHVIEVIDAERGDLTEFWDVGGDDFMKTLEKEGYVGFITNFGNGVNEYVVPDPNVLPDKAELVKEWQEANGVEAETAEDTELTLEQKEELTTEVIDSVLTSTNRAVINNKTNDKQGIIQSMKRRIDEVRPVVFNKYAKDDLKASHILSLDSTELAEAIYTKGLDKTEDNTQDNNNDNSNTDSTGEDKLSDPSTVSPDDVGQGGGETVDAGTNERTSPSEPRTRPSGTGTTSKLGKKGRADLNAEVLAILKATNYSTSPSSYSDTQLAKLMQYSGAGGKADAGAEGIGLLSEYYTDPKIVDKLWQIANHYIKANSVYEPSVGTGNILMKAPEGIELAGTEYQKVSGTIAQILIPEANITIGNSDMFDNAGDFQSLFFDTETKREKPLEKRYDLIIGNPPFGKRSGFFKGRGEEKNILRQEEYFIKRGLDLANEGGIVAYVVNSSFLTKGYSRGKERIAGVGEIVDAYRLPEGIFSDTGVGTDIVVFKKSTPAKKADASERVKKMSDDAMFADKSKIAGEEKTRTNRFGKEETYVSGTIDNLDTIGNLEATKEEVVATPEVVDTTPAVEKIKKAVSKKEETTETKTKTKKKAGAKQQVYTNEDVKRMTGRKVPATHPLKNISNTPADLPQAQLETYTEVDRDGFVDFTEERAPYLNYTNGKYQNDILYYSGNIAERLEQLKRDKKNMSDEQYARQETGLNSILPKEKTALEIVWSPHDTTVTEKRFVDANDRETTISSAFQNQLRSSQYGARRAVLSPNVLVSDILGLIDGKRARKDTKDLKGAIASDLKRLYTDFILNKLPEEVRKEIVTDFNKQKNSIIAPNYDNIPVPIKGMAKDFRGNVFTPTETQKSGVAFLVNKGTGLLSWGVGVGKTFGILLATVANMQKGNAKRPLFIVPSSTIEKTWLTTMLATFPDVNVVNLGGLTKPEITRLKKERGDDPSKWVKDGELAIISHEGIGKFGLSKEDISEAMTDLKDAMFDAERESKGRKKAQGNEDVLETIAKLQGDSELSFTDMGFDHISVDEVHNFRKVFKGAKKEKSEDGGKARFSNVIGGNPSKRAQKLFLLSQMVQRRNNGRNVFLASATPFENHATEIYNILSFVARDRMKSMGIYNINDFFAAYGNFESQMIVKPGGDVKEQEVMKSFANTDSLRALLREFMDLRVDETLIRPDKVITTPKLAMSRMQLDNNDKIQSMFNGTWEKMGIELSKEQADAISLIAQGYSISNAVSPYFVEKFHSKNFTATEMVENSPKLKFAYEVIKTSRENRKTKDFGTFVYMGKHGIANGGQTKFADYIAENLGYKKNEVAVLNGDTSMVDRENIKERFNDGTLKVLIGGDPTKEGIDLQNNGFATVNVALGWNPTEVVQVEGRVWRQGNKRSLVPIFYPLIENSGDVNMYQKFSEKGGRLDDLMNAEGTEYDVGSVDVEEQILALITDPESKANLAIAIQKKELEQQKIGSETVREALQTDKSNFETFNTQVERIEKNIKDGRAYGAELTANEVQDKKNDLRSIKGKRETIINRLMERGVRPEGIEAELSRLASEIAEIESKISAIKESKEKLKKGFTEDVERFNRERKTIEEYTAEFDAVITNDLLERTEDELIEMKRKRIEQLTGKKEENTAKFEPVSEEVVATPAPKKKKPAKKTTTKKAPAKKKKPAKKTKDERTMAILMDDSLSVPEKVSSILEEKQDGKKFKDVGKRVSGSKKERAAITTVMENGSKAVIAELIKTLGGQVVADTLKKAEILKDTKTPKVETDKEAGVPAIVAGWKINVFNNIATTPNLSQKTGKWGSQVNVAEEEVDLFLSEYPDLLRTFVEELNAVENADDLVAFAGKYDYKLKKTELNNDSEKGYVINGKGVINIAVLGKTIEKAIKGAQDRATILTQVNTLRSMLEAGTPTETTNYSNEPSYIGFGRSRWGGYTTYFDNQAEAQETFNNEEIVDNIKAYITDVTENYEAYAPKRKTKSDTVDTSHGNFAPIEKYTRKVEPKRVEADTLTKEMGFKSVQLGNYMDDVSAKEHIEQTIGAVEDMSVALGVDFPKLFNDFGLNIAFGARGGGKFLAHYEPSNNIINLTKSRGDGSLFHELVHFFDWKTNKNGLRDKWSSTRKRNYYRPNSYDRSTLDLVNALEGAKRVQREYKPRGDIAELTDAEKTVRAGVIADFEAEVPLKDVIVRNTYTEEYYQAVADIYNESYTKEDILWSEKNDFYKNALEIGGGSDTSYWVRPHELLARAGQAYIEDKMIEKGNFNPYVTRSTIDQRAYPQGEERVRFNKLFDAVFAHMAQEYPLRQSEDGKPELNARFKTKDSSQTVVAGSHAIPFLRSVKKRFGLDFDVRFVDTILVQSFDKAKMRERAEAWGATLGNTIVLAKEITRWTGQHEVGHLIFDNLDKIRVFKDEGITKQALIRAQAEKMRKAGNLKFVGRIGVQESRLLEEQIMLDFEQYLEQKYQPDAPLLKRFFLLLKRAVMRFARAIQATDGNIITEFYETIDEGQQIQETMIPLETDGILSAYIESVRQGELSYEIAEKMMGGARFKIREETDKVLQKIKVEYNKTETQLTTKQEELQKREDQLTAEIERKGRLAENVEETPESVRKLRANTTKSGELTEAGVSKLDEYDFENPQEAEAEIAEYVKNKAELLEARNSLGKVRREIAMLKRGSKTDKAVLRDIERKLKARQEMLKRKDYYVDMGVGQGKKEQMKMIRKRGRALNDLQDLIGLSDARAKSLIGDLTKQKIHLMSEQEFDNFIIRFTNQGSDLANKLFEQDSVRSLIQDRRFNKEDNLRKAMKLPTIGKMSAEQAQLFFNALQEYKLGDTFLTQRQLETIHRTDWGGKTKREMHQAIFERTNITEEDMKNVQTDNMQNFKNWLVLSRSNPMFAWLVDQRFKAEIQTQSEVVMFEEEMNKVMKKARKSRTRSFVESVRQLVAPMDELVFGYIEAENKEQYRIDNEMTKEEVEASLWLMTHLFLPAKEYMSTEYAMNTRENYITHIRRGVGEAFIQSLEEVDENGKRTSVPKAVVTAVRELFKAQKEDEMGFTIMAGQTGKVIAFEKWFQFAMPRTGGLMPSKNVAKVSLAYASVYYKKKALDKLVPEAMALLKVQEEIKGYTQKGLPLDPSIREFTDKFLNDAKGRKITILFNQGSTADNALRLGVAWTAFKFLGFRPVLGMVNFIGEFVGVTRATTSKEKWRGLTRSFQVSKANRVGEKGRYFTGRNPLTELFDPQFEITTRVKNAAMVLFSLASFFNNRFYLRAKMTETEWQNELMEDERMLTIVKEISKWRKTPFYISSLAGSTSEASVFNQFATWALPIFNTTMSDTQQLIKQGREKGWKEGFTSEEAKSLGTTIALIGTMWFIAMAIKAGAGSDDDERDIWFYITREMNTMIGAFQVVWDVEGRAPLLSQLWDLQEAIVQLITQEKYKRDGEGYTLGDLKATNSFRKLLEPTFVRDGREFVFGEQERGDRRGELLQEAISSGNFDPRMIAETLNPTDWNNQGSDTRTPEKQLEYQERKVADVTMEYNLLSKYGDSKIAEIVLTVNNNGERVQKMIEYGEEVGHDKVYTELRKIYKDKSLCGNQKNKTVCPVSGQLFDEYRKTQK